MIRCERGIPLTSTVPEVPTFLGMRPARTFNSVVLPLPGGVVGGRGAASQVFGTDGCANERTNDSLVDW